MKGDFSRQTFDAGKHYRTVLSQQGRVQVDADANEQHAIDQHLDQTEMRDIIGLTGAPYGSDAGFAINTDGVNVTVEPGRYYVDGTLCENENRSGVDFTNQADLPGQESVLSILQKAKAAYGLVYLDVWQRHITSLEDDHIREKALGGPDTATRAKTVWQVKVWPVQSGDPAQLNTLLSEQKRLQDLLDKLDSTKVEDVIRGWAFRAILKNIQAEIADRKGVVACSTEFSNWQAQIAPSSGTMDAHTHAPDPASSPCQLPPGAGYLRLENQLYRVEIHKGGDRSSATFKWSRDNGSVVTTIDSFDPANKKITVHDLGRDDTLGFANGQWVELMDDRGELKGEPGQLVQAQMDRDTREFTLPFALAPIDQKFHPKLRRWDQPNSGALSGGVAAGIAMTSDWIPIDDSGIEIKFSEGTYKTGDYWLIPARTATAEIEWPPDSAPGPTPRPPFGIRHSYAKLALLSLQTDKLSLFSDCRSFFPPVTELTELFYVGGDGQEAMPAPNGATVPLPQLLTVGVANGSWPVIGATVWFEVVLGSGTVTSPAHTDYRGLATCPWQIDSTTQSQQVRATLRDSIGRQVGLPVIFNANLSVADQVAYKPGDCAKLQNQTTVQKALDTLAHLVSLYRLSSSDRLFKPGETIELSVLVANRCGPIVNQPNPPGIVTFKIRSGSGTLDGKAGDATVGTDKDGVATCKWVPDSATSYQEVEASLVATVSSTAPDKVHFSATRSASGGCCTTVGAGGDFPTLDEAIKTLLDNAKDPNNVDICICLLPGDHVLKTGLNIDGAKTKRSVHIKIEGCGSGSRVLPGANKWMFSGLASFTLRNLDLLAGPDVIVSLSSCLDITVEGCTLLQENQQQDRPFIMMDKARHIRFQGNIVNAFLPMSQNARPIPKSFVSVINSDIPGFKELFSLDDNSKFDELSARLADQLAALDPTKKPRIAAALLGELEKSGSMLTNHEGLVFKSLVGMLNGQIPERYKEVFAAIRLASLQAGPGVALVFMDAQADTRLEGNNIAGVVGLYGLPRKLPITVEEIQKNIGPQLKQTEQPAINFSSSLANLHVLDNSLFRIGVPGTIISDLVAATSSKPLSLGFLYRRCFITGNAFNGEASDLLMEHVALSSNSFEPMMREGDVGNVVAQAAIYVGNYAPTGSRLFNAAKTNSKSSNLGINIVDA